MFEKLEGALKNEKFAQSKYIDHKIAMKLLETMRKNNIQNGFLIGAIMKPIAISMKKNLINLG